jgi:hypothetical protein
MVRAILLLLLLASAALACTEPDTLSTCLYNRTQTLMNLYDGLATTVGHPGCATPTQLDFFWRRLATSLDFHAYTNTASNTIFEGCDADSDGYACPSEITSSICTCLPTCVAVMKVTAMYNAMHAYPNWAASDVPWRNACAAGEHWRC